MAIDGDPNPRRKTKCCRTSGRCSQSAEALDEADDDYLLTVDEVAADLGIDLDE